MAGNCLFGDCCIHGCLVDTVRASQTSEWQGGILRKLQLRSKRDIEKLIRRVATKTERASLPRIAGTRQGTCERHAPLYKTRSRSLTAHPFLLSNIGKV